MPVPDHGQLLGVAAVVPEQRRARSSVALCHAPTPPAGFRPGGTRARAGDPVPTLSWQLRPGPDRVPDLEVRLHTPIPQVVIVRVAGTVDRAGAALLTERVGQQLTRADHVVLDLAEVAVMGADGVRVLCDLHRQASAYGTALHLAGADQPAINGPLRAAGMDQLIALAPSADAVIALLHRTAIRRTPLSDDPRHQRIPGP